MNIQEKRRYATEVAQLDMRIANLRRADGKLTLGLETDAGMLDLAATAALLQMSAPCDMDDLLQNQRAGDLSAILEAVERTGTLRLMSDADVAFAPVVTRPEKIICVGFNYRSHVEETGVSLPKAPPLFSKFNNALNHHDGVVNLPLHIDREFDYETELVIVFGRTCRDVSESDALDVVAGYATGNDMSARTLQSNTSQFLAGKCLDGFAPIGPWLVPRDRVPDPNALRIQTSVNRELRQDANTADMIFSCRQLISYVSSLMTIKPGDVVFTGTPQGVILGQKIPREQRQWLKPGDTVVSSLEGLGDLRVTLR